MQPAPRPSLPPGWRCVRRAAVATHPVVMPTPTFPTSQNRAATTTAGRSASAYRPPSSTRLMGNPTSATASSACRWSASTRGTWTPTPGAGTSPGRAAATRRTRASSLHYLSSRRGKEADATALGKFRLLTSAATGGIVPLRNSAIVALTHTRAAVSLRLTASPFTLN